MEYSIGKNQENFYELLQENALLEDGDACFTFYEFEGEVRKK